MKKIPVCACLTTVLLSGSAYASDIRPMHYVQYAEGVVKGIGSDHEFVICDKCPQLSKLEPRKQQMMDDVSIRISETLQTPEEEQVATATEKVVRQEFKFNLNDYRLTKKEQGRIKLFASLLKDMEGVESIAVKGFTCDLGAEKYNDKLAVKRAKSVARVLAGHGVPSRDIEVTGDGECCYKSKTDRAKNRRVEVTVKKKGEASDEE